MTVAIPEIDWSAIFPVIIVVLGGVAVLFWDVFHARPDRSLIVAMAMATLAAAFGSTLATHPGDVSPVTFGGMYVYDGFTRSVFLLILSASFLSVLVAAAQRTLEDSPAGEYYCLILFATSGMMLMGSTNNLLMVFVGLEIFSLCLYILAGYLRTRPEGNEAALKYFLLGSFASGFFLYGMALLFGATGSVDMAEIARRLVEHPPSRSTTFLLGIGFIVIGLGFKVAAAPFYMWTPDVYEGAPTAVTAFMSVGPKVAAFAAFFRLVLSVAPFTESGIGPVLWVMAVLTMSVANVVAIWQSSLKRMLAYSSIAHAGYLLVALVSSKESPELARSGFLYYMLVYAFMNMGAFCVIVATGAKGEERIRIEDYAGMGFARPGLAAAMTVFMFSLAGLPPTGGFVAKFYVFSAAVNAGYVYLVIIAVLNSVVAAFYYLRVVVMMYMHEAPGGVGVSAAPSRSWSYAFTALVLGVAGTLNLGIFPAAVMDFALRSVSLLN